MRSSNRQFLEKINAQKDELIKKGKILSSVHRISQLLNRPAKRDKILQAILHESQKIFRFTRGIILLLNKGEEKLEAKYCNGFEPAEEIHALSHPLDMKTQICRETITASTGKLIYVRDVKNNMCLTDFDRKMEKVWKRVSTITVPLKINREVLGVIEGDRVDQEMVLNRNDIKLLTVFANQASIILENARLYDQLLTERNIAENILEGVPNGILAIDENRKIRSINRKAEEILKVKRRRVLGKPICGTVKNKIAMLLNDTLESSKAEQYAEIVSESEDGTPRIYGVNSAILNGHTGHAVGAVMTIQDLTEIKQTEAMLRRVDNLSSLGQMSANIAHEIRNPLASINFNVQMLSKKLMNDSDLQRRLSNTMEGIDRIKMIIKRTLDLSKKINPFMKYGQLNDVLEDAISLITQQLNMRKIVVKKDLEASLPDIRFDQFQIRNVLVNLLLNAIEAMPKSGIITIKSRIEDNFKLQNTQWLLLTIKDNGVGIHHENLKRIFDPFFTTKPDGTGLGLSIAHKILQHHNALIDVRSRENRGTSFFLRFPLNEATRKYV